MEIQSTCNSQSGTSTPSRPSNYSSSSVSFPKRPAIAQFGQQVSLQTNSYMLNIKNRDVKDVQKYSVQYEPELPANSKVKNMLLGKPNVKPNLKEKFDFYIAFSGNLYTYRMIADPLVFTAEHDGQEYKISIIWSKSIKLNDNELYSFYGIFFKNILRKMDFERIGRNAFCPKAAKYLNQHNLEVWPGFYSAMQKLESGPLIMIDLTNKVVRKDSVLSVIKDHLQKGKGDDFINEQLQNAIVVTNYGDNKKTYRIESVDFNRSPSSTFKCGKEEKETSFMEYYQKRYSLSIQDSNQPLLISKNERTGLEVALIPELCSMTGLTDQQRANFNLMKDLSQILHKNANDRKQEATNLIKQMSAHQRVKKVMDEWGLEFNAEPFQIKGQRITGGNIVMGKNASNERLQFPMDCNPNDFDRNIQQPMYQQPDLMAWGIFYEGFNKKEAVQFSNEMQKCFEQFKFKCGAPRMFEVQGKRFDQWERCLKDNLNARVQAVVCIIAGQKNKGFIYDDLKRFLMTTCPVPSQVVLVNTISKGKNLRSICNKILIQINAKIGGEPWSVSNLPFIKKPTMVIGYDVHHKRRQKSLLAFCATINMNLDKYWSKVELQDGEMDEIANKSLEKVMTSALAKFKQVNNTYPKQIIIYRDGVGEGQKQTVMKTEIEVFSQALKKVGIEQDCKFIFVMVNKRVKTKFVQDNNGRLDNVRPGTFVDHSITPNQLYDFFLVSQNCRQGVATPSHYSILYDSINEDPKNIIDLTYKLCYLYYNYSGPVKIPAPVKYADKLAKMMGERNNIIPHDHFENINGMYYI